MSFTPSYEVLRTGTDRNGEFGFADDKSPAQITKYHEGNGTVYNRLHDMKLGLHGAMRP